MKLTLPDDSDVLANVYEHIRGYVVEIEHFVWDKEHVGANLETHTYEFQGIEPSLNISGLLVRDWNDELGSPTTGPEFMISLMDVEHITVV